MSLFDALLDLRGADSATVNRLVGYADVSGHRYAVFGEAEPVTVVIRPWQTPGQRVAEGGQTGRSEHYRVYATDAHGFTRDDRLNWRGDHLRLTNPEYSEHESMVRWTAQTDERELRLESDVADEHEITPPEEGAGG